MRYEIRMCDASISQKLNCLHVIKNSFPHKSDFGVKYMNQFESCLVHEHLGQIVAVLALTLAVGAAEKILNIQNVCVLPEYRKRGIGGKLLEELIHTKAQKYTLQLHVDLEQPHGSDSEQMFGPPPLFLLNWYKKHGFSIHSRTEVDVEMRFLAKDNNDRKIFV